MFNAYLYVLNRAAKGAEAGIYETRRAAQGSEEKQHYLGEKAGV